MVDNIEKVMKLGCCDSDEAIALLNKSGNDVMEAVSLKMNIPPGRDAPKPRDLSMIQQFFKETREEMTRLTESISKGFISDQSAPLEQAEMQSLPEEMARQSNCPEQYRPFSPVSEVQIPEIVCQSPSVCFSGLLSSDQRLPCFVQEFRRSCPSPETESSEKAAETTALDP